MSRLSAIAFTCSYYSFALCIISESFPAYWLCSSHTSSLLFVTLTKFESNFKRRFGVLCSCPDIRVLKLISSNILVVFLKRGSTKCWQSNWDRFRFSTLSSVFAPSDSLNLSFRICFCFLSFVSSLLFCSAASLVPSWSESSLITAISC